MKVSQEILLLFMEDETIVNDDWRLIAAIWRNRGWNDWIGLEDNLPKMPSVESITRARRKLHEIGLIKYNKEALDRRTKDFRKYRNEIDL